MASIVESVVSFLLTKLGDRLLQEASSLLGVHDQLEWVESQFRWMQAFLKDAEAKSDKDERMKQWMREVRDVAHLAEDIIDTFMVEVAPSVRGRRISGAIKRYTSFFTEIHARHDLVSKIEKMKEKIISIKTSRDAFGIQETGQREQSTSSPARSLIDRRRRLSSPYFEDEDLVGLETDREVLIRRLTQGEPERSIISIVGMGGLGKTTLARKLYQTDAVKGHFNDCIWITVSQAYDEKELLRAAMKRCVDLTHQQQLEKMENDEICSKISEYLRGRRYLVVMDDVWKSDAWDALKYAFPDSENGSRVLVTSRNKEVALYMDANSQPHHLMSLNEDDSWKLFLKKVSSGHETNLPADAEPRLRKDILSKCQGLPLAIVVLGGLLSRRKEVREWERILKSQWQLIEGEDGMSGILALSYRDLPYYLKPCFLYLGIFPEDHDIPAKKLILMWAAEGFLQETGGLTLEEMGEECLRELIQRSMIQVSSTGSSGAAKSCRIHDLLRDLAISEANRDEFLEVHSESTPSSSSCRSRRLAIHHKDRFDSLNHTNPNLRSLSILIGEQKSYWMVDVADRIENKLAFRSFKLLRVLDMEGVRIRRKLASEMGGLIHLRYLGYRGVVDGSFQSNVAKLVNLETISITVDWKAFNSLFDPAIRIRPLSIGKKMQQLRHIKFKREWWPIDLKGYASNVKQLSNGTGSSSSLPLQILANVDIGEWMKNDGLLERLSNLRKLGIKIGPMITDVSAKEAWKSIMRLKSLESLHVSAWPFGEDLSLGKVPPLNQYLPKLRKLKLEGTLQENHPPSAVLCELPRNLTKLTLIGSRLDEDPLPVLERLENLRFLKLGRLSFVAEKMACTSGGFPQLQFLHFDNLDKWREWQVEKGSLPCLSHLTVNRCRGLEEVPETLRDISTLKTVEIID